MRQPLPPTHQGHRGRHEGIKTVNMPWEIYLACSDGESVNAELYEQLHTTLDIDALYDILEMKAVHASWVEAARLNAKETPDDG